MNTNSIAKFQLVFWRITTPIRRVEWITRWTHWYNASPYLISWYNMWILQTYGKFSTMRREGGIHKSWEEQVPRKTTQIKVTYNFNSSANESIGDNVPDVKMIDPTPNLENSSNAIPGLKHHQLKVRDALPVTPKFHGQVYKPIVANSYHNLFENPSLLY